MAKNSINLLPKLSAEQVTISRKRQFRYILLGALFAVLVIVWVASFVFVQILANEEKNLRDASVAKEQEITQFAQVESLYRSIYNRIGGAKVALDKQKILGEGIAKLEQFIVPGVTMKSVIFSERDALLTISTIDIAAVISYLDGLERDDIGKFFKELTVSSITVDKTNGYGVKIEGTLTP